MPADSRTNAIFRERYWSGDIADAPSDGELFIDSSNTNRITVYRGGSWVTPRFDAITLTGTTTYTTLTGPTLTVASLATIQALQVAGTASLTTSRITTLTVTTETVASLGTTQGLQVAGTASLTTSQITTLTAVNGTVASTGTIQAMQVAGVASMANIQAELLTVDTPAASATGAVVLGNSAVPTTANSTSGFVQISALPGTPVGQTANPAANTVFLTFDTTRLAIVAKVGSAWYATASMSIY